MSAPKTAAPKRAARKTKTAPSDAPTGPEAETGAGDAPAVTQVVRLKEMVGRVAETSGLRRNQVKPVMDAVLRELGEALARGEALNLPPMGKISINRTRETNSADIIVMKLRRSKTMVENNAPDATDTGAKSDDETLADSAE